MLILFVSCDKSLISYSDIISINSLEDFRNIMRDNEFVKVSDNYKWEEYELFLDNKSNNNKPIKSFYEFESDSFWLDYRKGSSPNKKEYSQFFSFVKSNAINVNDKLSVDVEEFIVFYYNEKFIWFSTSKKNMSVLITNI